jgi:hypothetical protein
MFENLKAGDTIKIGEKKFKVLYVDGALEIKNSKGERDTFTTNELEFLGAEIVRKAPPENTPVYEDGIFAVSCGYLNGFGELVVHFGAMIGSMPKWKVLEIEK